MSDVRPVTVLISALGGEGGGLMTDWILAAAREHNLVCQATSVPGVAQRTGATTYYIEVFNQKLEPGKPEPVMALYPQAGDIDMMVASELAEASRACQNGFVTPDRTTLITSTHRFYLLDEKMGMADSRLDAERLENAIRKMAKKVIAADFARASRDSGTVINAVLLGAIAGCGLLPMPVEAFERAIKGEGKGAEASLRGFYYGLSVARGEVVELQRRRKRQLFPIRWRRCATVSCATFRRWPMRSSWRARRALSIIRISTTPNSTLTGLVRCWRQSGWRRATS